MVQKYKNITTNNRRYFGNQYEPLTTGKPGIKENKERLFLCQGFEPVKEIIQSPLNYTGDKYQLLLQLLPLFPKDTECVVDCFAVAVMWESMWTAKGLILMI